MSDDPTRIAPVAHERNATLLEARPQHTVDGKKFAPLSFSQQQLWYVCQFQSGTVAYNQPVAWRLTGPVQVRALEESLNAVISRHEALRTTFPIVEGSPVQCIHSRFALTLNVVDLRRFPAADREVRVQELILEESCHSFAFSTDLLLRATLLRTGDDSYVFVIVVHHIVCDGWSMGILIQELARFYRAFASGIDLTLDPLPIQYAGFAMWQRERLQGETVEGQLDYWKKQLDGSCMPELPTDKPHAPISGFRGASLPFTFPPETSAAFKALTAREGAFLFMGLLAAFQTLVYRYTAQSDIVVGAPVASRRRAKLQGLIGMFVNLVALRCQVSGASTFRELLRQARDVVMGAYQHQDLPFEKVVEELNPVRDRGRSPLFQVMLDQVDPRWVALDLEGVEANWFSVDNRTAKFDLTLAWFDSPDGLKGWVEYNTDLFAEATIARLLGHYRMILESVAANPDQLISEIPMLTGEERRQLLVEWNATESEYPQSCIHQLFEQQAERTPHAVVVEAGEQQFTYEQLNRRANQLAHSLKKAGVQPGNFVGVCMDRNCDLVVALLSVLKAGAAYVPLDPSYPRARLEFMVKDSGLTTLLTQERWVEGLPKGDATLICLNGERERLDQESDDNLQVEMSPDDLAYLIYTSGSTGRPKGVLGLHRGAVNRITWMWNKYPFKAGEIACAKTSVSFVDSVWEIFGALLAGVPTVMISDEVAKDPAGLLAILAEHRVTRVVLVPSLLRALLDTSKDLANRLPHLKHWTSSGEALPIDLVRRFRDSMPERLLLNLYGSSEVSADATYFDTGEMQPDDPILIGRPIANMQAHILDETLHPVPVGITGQLCVSGSGLARGYHNQEERTTEKFIFNPLSDHPGNRLYLTGDLARYRPDGNIELLGRMDHQVKIRGFRIELEEIESLLKQHRDVEQAVVARRDGVGGERLVAYLILKETADWREFGEGLETSEKTWSGCAGDISPVATLGVRFRPYLKEQLPEYMVPADFVVLSSFPLTPSGKIDRLSLPDPQAPRPEPTVGYVEAHTPTERIIQNVWSEVLGIEHVGTHDNFFDLGGHSLLLATVHSKLTKFLEYEISGLELYQYPTINSLAARLDHGTREPSRSHSAQERARKQKEALRRKRETITARSTMTSGHED